MACIQCGACVSACLSLEVDPEFIGPAALAKAYRFVGEMEEIADFVGEDPAARKMFEAIAAVRKISEKLGKPMDALSLAWVLAQPGVTSVLAGARNPDQVRRNVRAAETELTAEAVAELSAATEKVKKALGDNLHMWVMPKKK